MFRPELKELITEGKIYDLGQPWHPGMPHHPLHPPWQRGDELFLSSPSPGRLGL